VQNIQTIETRLNTPPTSKNSRILSTILEWDNIRNGENGAADHGDSAYAPATPARAKQEPKTYVKSPLMRSYDSGIYSHEVSSSKWNATIISNGYCLSISQLFLFIYKQKTFSALSQNSKTRRHYLGMMEL
jgi:hypothetical protein